MEETGSEGKPKWDADRTVKLTWKDISEAELRGALASVKSGSDPAAAKRLIEYFYKRIHDNLSLDQTILFEYLDHVFGRVVDGQPAERAFGLEQPPAKE